MKPYNCKLFLFDSNTWYPVIVQTNNYYYPIGTVTWNHIIVYKLLVLDSNTWNHRDAYKQIIIIIKQESLLEMI